MKHEYNTKQVENTYVEEHKGMVPTFITTCDNCGNEHKWMTTGVMISYITCGKCNKINTIDWSKIDNPEKNIKRIICLYGGPGLGKSTVCAGLFYNLKMMHYECEMNREYIKDWIWEGRPPQDGDQSYFFAKMARKERIFMANNLDFIITDSPLILTHYYGLMYDKFEQKFNTSLSMLKNHHQICKENGYKIDHFLLKRVKPYSELGRNQKEDRAKEIDGEIEKLLNDFNIKYHEVNSDESCVDNILHHYEGLIGG